MKRTVKQDIIDNVALTASKHITSAEEVPEHVRRARFSTDDWKAAHATSTSNEIIIVYGSTQEIYGMRPPPDHDYATIEGMKKCYLFTALASGVVAMRTCSCWCLACMEAIRRGEGSLNSSLNCRGCVSPQLKWHERSVV